MSTGEEKELEREEKRTRAETGTVHDRLDFLSLKTDVKLKVVDIPIELLSRPSDLGIRIPFQEAFVCCQKYDPFSKNARSNL